MVTASLKFGIELHLVDHNFELVSIPCNP